LKWIEFRDSNREKKCQNSTNLEPILDSDILFGNNSSRMYVIEQESYNLSIVSILLSLAYAYMELRHFTEAIECINEGLDYNNENPDLYFRRSQALLYNKNSNTIQLELALNDIQKAILYNTSKQIIIYEDHLVLLKKTIENRQNNEVLKIEGKLIYKLYIISI